MKKLWLLALLTLPLLSWAQQSFTVNGNLKNFSTLPEKIIFRYRIPGGSRIDSVPVINQQYQIKGTIEDPTLLTLVQNRVSITVFIEPGTIQVDHQERFPAITVTGSKADQDYRILESTLTPLEQKQEPLYAAYNQARKEKDQAGMEKAEKAIEDIDAAIKEQVYRAFVTKNPNSPIALYAVQQYAGYDIDPNQVAPLFESLPKEVRQGTAGKALDERIQTAYKTAVGQMALDFTQNDTLGKPVALHDFKGKYVLVDFWASWCGPCRVENPNVVKAYQRFHQKGFEVLGVSLDRPDAKEKWIKAIHDDRLTWTHVSDLQFWNNAVAKLYGIQAIPQNYLVDPAGKIIAKNIRGEALQTALEKYIQ
jgi:peroxiredoxin